MDILNAAEQWAQHEHAIAEALHQYRQGNRKPLLILLFFHKDRPLPPSLHRGIRALLLKKNGRPLTIGPVERVHRLNMAIVAKVEYDEGRAEGRTLDEACETVAAWFRTSDSIVKHAYLEQYPAPRARSRTR